MRILVTGADGFVAGELINQLCDDEKRHQVIAASHDPVGTRRYFGKDDIEYIANKDLLDTAVTVGKADVLVHTAFSRSANGAQLYKSIEFSRSIFEWAVSNKVKAIINISSQAVYGFAAGPLRSESSPVCPTDLYGMAKCASELLLKNAVANSGNATRHTSIRLASVIGSGIRSQKKAFHKMLENALAGHNIHVWGGRQIFSCIDIRDTAKALSLLLERDSQLWQQIYNLGPQNPIGIMDVAEIARELAVNITGKPVEIIFEDSDAELDLGLNCGLFYKDISWKPEFSFFDSAKEIARQIENIYKANR